MDAAEYAFHFFLPSAVLAFPEFSLAEILKFNLETGSLRDFRVQFVKQMFGPTTYKSSRLRLYLANVGA
jgi:hypothetical protein